MGIGSGPLLGIIAAVTTAVANGDLSKKITVDVKGEILELKNTINTMVDQLSSFASEVTRVAKEVGKTHPNAKILNCAYGVYTLPPLKIDQLEPNVLVGIVGGRRPMNKAGNKAEGEAAPEALRSAWAKKTAVCRW